MRTRTVALVALLLLVLVPVSHAVEARTNDASGAYDFRWETRTAIPELPSAYQGQNLAQGFNAWIGSDGIRVRPRGDGEPAWELALALAGVGRGQELQRVEAAGTNAQGRRAELDRGSITEYFVNDEQGLKHGFTVTEGPGEKGTEPLVLELTLGTELVARPRPSGRGIDFLQPGVPLAVLGYGGLLVEDSSGQEIPSRMEVAGADESGGGVIRILIEDHDAVYPLEVDPLLTTASWSSEDTDSTRQVAWGDWDGDGDLDLAAANNGANRVYENTGGILTTTSVWISSDTDDSFSVAWGDWDGDGDLDLAAGNYRIPNRVYSNDGLGNSDSLLSVWTSADSDETRSVAWGDWDGDGDLDLAVGNLNGEPNRIYENDGLGNSNSLVSAWTSVEADTP